MTVSVREEVLLDGVAGQQGKPSDVRMAEMEAGQVKAIDSRTIFGSDKEVQIRHGDQMYRLRITRHGKLILNK